MIRNFVTILLVGLIAVGCGSKDPQSLVKDLSHRDEKVRARAAFKLGEMGKGATVAVPALIEALEDDNVDVVIWSMHALGEIGPEAKSAVPVLQKKLSADNFNIRNLAKFALEKIGEHSVPAIIDKLSADNRNTRKEAAELLIKIGKPALAELRKSALSHKDYKARYWCTHAIGELDPASKETAELMEKLKKDKSSAVREKAVEILDKMKEGEKEAS